MFPAEGQSHSVSTETLGYAPSAGLIQPSRSPTNFCWKHIVYDIDLSTTATGSRIAKKLQLLLQLPPLNQYWVTRRGGISRNPYPSKRGDRVGSSLMGLCVSQASVFDSENTSDDAVCSLATVHSSYLRGHHRSDVVGGVRSVGFSLPLYRLLLIFESESHEPYRHSLSVSFCFTSLTTELCRVHYAAALGG